MRENITITAFTAADVKKNSTNYIRTLKKKNQYLINHSKNKVQINNSFYNTFFYKN